VKISSKYEDDLVIFIFELQIPLERHVQSQLHFGTSPATFMPRSIYLDTTPQSYPSTWPTFNCCSSTFGEMSLAATGSTLAALTTLFSFLSLNIYSFNHFICQVLLD
jgi:hypothetical protein